MAVLTEARPVEIGMPGSQTGRLQALLGLPDIARGLIVFAHGSGSGRLSPRNNYVARALAAVGFGTLLLDLLTPDEEGRRAAVFDIPLLASRLVLAIDWVREQAETRDLPIGLFGASTGAGAALLAAAKDKRVAAVVSRGGRPDLAGEALPQVRAPTLLIVGALDGPVIDLNRRAAAQLTAENELIVVPGAGHLFEEPGTLDEVVRQAVRWFSNHLVQGGFAKKGRGEAGHLP
jgi:putative phosphoribosyl transferase